MRELSRTAYFLITVDDEKKLVRRIRSNKAYESIADVELAHEAALKALDGIERRRHVLLVDVRLAPPRNDPAFEQAIQRYLPRLHVGFRRLAVLVQTEAGKLQIKRMTSSIPADLHVFTDEPAALSFLLRADTAALR
jgi:hypothetical protein